MKKIFTSCLLLVSICAFSQSAEEIITEGEVTRIIKTLSSDAMMGRPSMDPEKIEPSVLFIESEFKKIGLKPLRGLDSFRQQFEKEKITPVRSEVIIDGALVTKEDLVIVSDNEVINTSNLPVVSVAFDSTVTNKNQFFWGRVRELLQDTSSALILVSPEFRENFQQVKSYNSRRFRGQNKYTKVFVLGKASALTFSINVKQKVQTIMMTNVAGILEGKTRPEEMVLFSAHYDHIGILPAVEGDSIANGADDDASGTTAVIELARYFKKMDSNNRTLVFVAFTAEEIGGYGSRYFSEQLDPEKVVAMFNIEMIGKPSRWGQNAAFITGYERSDFGAILAKNATGTGFSFNPDPYPQQNLFYRSDNATLARLGVPAHSISTDQIDSDRFYHTVNDEFETIDIKNVVATIRAIALSAKSIIEGTDTPTRIDKATVK